MSSAGEFHPGRLWSLSDIKRQISVARFMQFSAMGGHAETWIKFDKNPEVEVSITVAFWF